MDLGFISATPHGACLFNEDIALPTVNKSSKRIKIRCDAPVKTEMTLLEQKVECRVGMWKCDTLRSDAFSFSLTPQLCISLCLPVCTESYLVLHFFSLSL